MNKKSFIILGIIIIFSLSGFFVYAFMNEGNSKEMSMVDGVVADSENYAVQNEGQDSSENVSPMMGQESKEEVQVVENNVSEQINVDSKESVVNDDNEIEEVEQKKETVEIVKTEEVKEVKTFKPFEFIVIADSESYKAASGYEEKFEGMLTKTASYKPDFAVFSGDLITQGGVDKARVTNLKSLIKKYYGKYYITFGKHDIECGDQCVDIWEDVFFNKKYVAGEKRALYHSFDYENTHFVLLSTDYPIKHAVDDAQLAWLNTDLTKNDKPNVIVVAHVPPVNFFKESAKECHDMSCNTTQRDKLINLFRKHKVDLVISGHEHVFDHKVVDGIDYVIAGGVGKSKRYKDTIYKDSFLYITVSGNNITLKSFGLGGDLIREIKVK